MARSDRRNYRRLPGETEETRLAFCTILLIKIKFAGVIVDN